MAKSEKVWAVIDGSTGSDLVRTSYDYTDDESPVQVVLPGTGGDVWLTVAQANEFIKDLKEAVAEDK